MNSVSMNVNNNVNFQGKGTVSKNGFKKFQAKVSEVKQQRAVKAKVKLDNVIAQVQNGNITTEQALSEIKNIAAKIGYKL